MGTENLEEFRKHLRLYIGVFVGLLALTVVTVAISYVHLSTVPAIALALVVAVSKGSLVALYFMHLISERKIIYWTLALTVFFLFVLLLLPTLTKLDGLWRG